MLGDEKKRKETFRWWPSGKSLEPRGLLPLWSQVRALWLLIWWSLEAYMVINFRARRISWGARKLARTFTLNLKKKKKRKERIPGGGVISLTTSGMTVTISFTATKSTWRCEGHGKNKKVLSLFEWFKREYLFKTFSGLRIYYPLHE
jgi:hypothetical protein